MCCVVYLLTVLELHLHFQIFLLQGSSRPASLPRTLQPTGAASVHSQRASTIQVSVFIQTRYTPHPHRRRIGNRPELSGRIAIAYNPVGLCTCVVKLNNPGLFLWERCCSGYVLKVVRLKKNGWFGLCTFVSMAIRLLNSDWMPIRLRCGWAFIYTIPAGQDTAIPNSGGVSEFPTPTAQNTSSCFGVPVPVSCVVERVPWTRTGTQNAAWWALTSNFIPQS